MRRLVAGLLAAVLPLSATATGGVVEPSAPKLHFNPFERPAAPQPEAVEATPVAPPVEWNPELRAVMVAGGASMANVDGVLLAIGDELEGHRLVEVTERRAVFERDGTLHELVIE